MVRHGIKHIFQKPTPDIDSSDRTQQLRSKTIYSGTVNLAQHLVKGNNGLYKTYNGPYEIASQAGNSKLIASRTYDDLLSITKGKVLLNQLPLTPLTRDYYQKNFAKGQLYEGNYNQFDPELNISKKCENAALVYDIGTTGFTGQASYNTNGGFIGATGPTGSTGVSDNNKRIFIDPNHCYYSDPCLLDASYTRFVSPGLTGTTGPTGTAGPALFNAQQIISSDQYRGFSYPMSNFNLACKQPFLDQEVGPLFCPPLNPNLSNFQDLIYQYSGGTTHTFAQPSSNSPGSFTYYSNNNSVVTVSGNQYTLIGPGVAIITAMQAESGNYSSANISARFNVSSYPPTPITPAFTTTNEQSTVNNIYLFGTAFQGANMTPYFDNNEESGFISANITNNSSGAISPFTSVSSGQTYTTLALYGGVTEGQNVTFTLSVTYSAPKPPITLTLTFQYVSRS
jgi:hypothetical protein